MDNFWKAMNDAIEEVEKNAPPTEDGVWEEARGESPQGVEKTPPPDVPEEEAPAAPAASASPEESPEEGRTPPPVKVGEWKELVVPECRDVVFACATAGSFHGAKIVDTPATAVAELVAESTGLPFDHPVHSADHEEKVIVGTTHQEGPEEEEEERRTRDQSADELHARQPFWSWPSQLGRKVSRARCHVFGVFHENFHNY